MATTLTVERLHARYHDVDPGMAERLDGALAAVAGGGLERALADTPLSDGFAVCVPALTVAVDLDPRQPVARLASDWAAVLVAELAMAVVTGPDRVGSPSGVVVWRHETDALVDLVRSVARGDQTRLWAWCQAGLMPGPVTRAGPVEVAAALRARPELVPGVLRSTTDLARVPLSVAGWMEVAAVVDRTVAPVSVGSTARIAAGPGRRVAAKRVAREAAALVPGEVWHAAGGRARSIAVLALAAVAPTASRDPAAIDAVLDVVADTAGVTLAGAAPVPNVGAGAEAEHGTVPPPERHAALDGVVPDRRLSAGAGDVGPVVSTWGGVFFLIHVFSSLDWPDPPTAEVLARVVSAVTGAPATDPATLAVAGWPASEPAPVLSAPPSAAVADAVGPYAADVDSCLRGVLERDGADPRDWIWRRRATVEAAPGWMDVRFSLDEVDVRVRRAGLDLDPGYVWWLGSVVRFVYG